VATFAILLVQVLLGAINVWAGEHAGLIVAHLTVGTLLWCSLVLVTMTALREPVASRARSRTEGNVQAVTA
jgi:heme A synthase